MSKKNRPNNNRNARPNMLPFPNLYENTILGRLEEYVDQNGGGLSGLQLCLWFTAEDMRAHGIIESKKERQIEELFEECANAYGFFELMRSSESGKLLVKSMKEYFCKEPLILQIGKDVSDELGEDPFPFTGDFDLSEEQHCAASILVDYIFNHDTDRNVSISTSNEDGEDVSEQLYFKKDLEEEDIADAKEFLSLWIAAELTYGGGMVVRFSGMGRDGKDVINGFSFSGGKIRVVSARQMKIDHETMPDGTRRSDPSAEYQTPTALLP